ncbi:hypothetical protein GQ44DRAFT_251380 [Phaeosphaeriaceae sp. PMI808]|nr:hypothetical protein GQ44DRAFT_251380 [Phaeosphaeriaceae sp. PMI808]
MDQPNTDNNRPELEAFLSTFEGLSVDDQATALQHMVRKGRGSSSIYKSNTIVDFSISANAHTCHICRRLEITYTRSDDGLTQYHSTKLTLTKETLQQGLIQKCILIEWVVILLGRGLHDLKSDITTRGTLMPRFETQKDFSDDLQYITSQGVFLDCYGNDDDEITFQLTFDVDPFLIDKLWLNAYDLHKGRTFDAFERAYIGKVEDQLRISAAASK